MDLDLQVDPSVTESKTLLVDEASPTPEVELEDPNSNMQKITETCRSNDSPKFATSRTALFGVIPAFGWSVPMTHVFQERWDQKIRPRLSQIPDLLPMALRYLVFRVILWFQGKQPFIDCITRDGKQIYGVPIGGIGSGSIGRGFKGEFCRYQMTPGLYTYDVVHANQFIVSVRDEEGSRLYQKVLSGAGDPGTLSSWDWTYKAEDGSYLGLYPRAVYTYRIPEENLVLKCKQISPVIPHNYKDSCLPVATFVWSIENQGIAAKDVSLTFTFKNGTGSKGDGAKKCSTVSFQGTNQCIPIHGVALEQIIEGIDTTYGIGCLEKADVSVTHMISFDLKNGSDIWSKLTKTGRLDTESCSYVISKGEVGIAVNSAGLVRANGTLEMVFVLTWDQPQVKFKGKQEIFTRRYTRYISREVEQKEEKSSTVAIQNLIGYALSHFQEWDEAIEQWQNPILNDPELPDWFKSALFNELYFVSDGGTVWFEYEHVLSDKAVGVKNQSPLPSRRSSYLAVPQDLRTEYGRFGYLEGHEYIMYNTYDVHFYSSFALALLWPKLQLSLQYDFADTIPHEDPTSRIHLFDGRKAPRKVKNSVPHDVGDPWEEPFVKINSYRVHDVAEWRDLNQKFVLQVYRDFKFTGDKQYLRDMLPLCLIVTEKCLAWDKDGDGLIENAGKPDQTYDSWIMSGPSAYCGGLWLGSLFAIVEMLKETENGIGEEEAASALKLFEDTLEKGRNAYEQKLWTGEYYQFDLSSGPYSKTIMSDQLCGHWFLSQCGVDDSRIFPQARVATALKTIYEKNVLGFCNGELGAANGMRPDGTVDTHSVQSEETWTGVTYALAATMISNGLTKEGFKTAEGIYRTVYEKIGMGFETPEALVHTKKYRAIGYMRPLSIWAMLNAWNRRKAPGGAEG